MKNSVINHPEKTPLVLLRQEYLTLTNNFVAAKLLSIFEFWTNKLKKVQKTAREWIYKTLETLHGELMGEHGIHSIRKALNILVDLGFISRRNNPHTPYDRTFQYRLDVENLQQALDNLNHDDQMDLEDQTDASCDTEKSICESDQINIIDSTTKELPQKSEVLKNKREKTVKLISAFFNVGFSQASQTLNIWTSEWNNRPTGRQWLTEQLQKLGLDPSCLISDF
ncbi:hypothetical protein WJM97_22820 (plasmid) [Okeanomitos corallinicola TIOX110]|uniref:Uncharacterized protein n=1 Tax=Okeanomitos corallinicola TIOX110 TaxID=3133117 RepID=A0ABZ2UYE2_9CYAN